MEEEEAWILVTGFSNMEVIGQLHKRSFIGVLGTKHNCSQRKKKKEEELGKATIVSVIKTKLQRYKICCICADPCLSDMSALEWDLLAADSRLCLLYRASQYNYKHNQSDIPSRSH